jgi:hypothetical protein
VLRWMKVVVLLAGALGVLAFFLPYFVFDLGNRKVNASAYELAFGFKDPHLDKLRSTKRPLCGKSPDTGEYVCDIDDLPNTRSLVPIYFASTIIFLLAGASAIWRKRMDLISGLSVLAASLFAIGCWLHEINSTLGVWHQTAIGAVLLGVSGLIALGPSIAVIYWREPDPVPLFKIRVPQARIVRR